MKNLFKDLNFEISTEAYNVLQETIRRIRDAREPIDNYLDNFNASGRILEDVEFLNLVRIAIDTMLNDFKYI